jgi:hypothetical protein
MNRIRQAMEFFWNQYITPTTMRCWGGYARFFEDADGKHLPSRLGEHLNAILHRGFKEHNVGLLAEAAKMLRQSHQKQPKPGVFVDVVPTIEAAEGAVLLDAAIQEIKSFSDGAGI